MIEDGSFVYMKPAKQNGPEEDGPDAEADLFEADVEAAEELRDVDPSGVPSDASVGGDFACLEVGGVLEGWEFGGERPDRGFVDGGGWLLAEGLVWPDIVVIGAELVEAALLS